ncbi:MAG: hypothetical protein WAU33_17240 [Candidatus Binataceae bacterium]
MAAIVGVALMLLFMLGAEPRMARVSLLLWIWLIFLFGGIPAIFILLIGWVVAGFRQEKSN